MERLHVAVSCSAEPCARSDTLQEERPQLASRDLQYLRKRKLDMDELLGLEPLEELRAMS